MSFETAFEAMIRREGGYVLHKVEGDTGGQTYAGIARVPNPQWPGWAYIDRSEIPPTQLVRDFYRASYWVPIAGDQLPEPIAATVFDFAVNAGTRVAIKLAQLVAGSTPDGSMGAKSIEAIARLNPDTFQVAYALAKLKRYADICNKDRVQSKFLLGWVNRLLGQA
ncbi:MAG: glycoside hydrolase family 108 protein [Leptothrix sp. (in: b-proteobacteria)]